MPKYHYSCNVCVEDFYVIHPMNEVLDECPKCRNVETLTKLLTQPAHIKDKKKLDFNRLMADSKARSGEISKNVKKYIEDNKEILKDMKKEAKNETYE